VPTPQERSRLADAELKGKPSASRPSLLRALFNSYGRPYLLLGLIKLGNDALSFAGPVLLNLLIRCACTLRGVAGSPPAGIVK
jgi:hypothetical protein